MKKAKLKDFSIEGKKLKLFARMTHRGGTVYQLYTTDGDELTDDCKMEGLIETLCTIKDDIEEVFGLVKEGDELTLTEPHIVELEEQFKHDPA